MTANSLARPSDRQADIAARKVIFLEGLNRWVQARRHDERMSRADFASLDSLGKLHAQRQSLLDNLAFYYGNHPNADVAPGVLAFITIYSDNADGCCTVSVDRMARFFSRSPRRVREAITKLEASEFDARTGKLISTGVGAIVVEREPGATSKIYPWVHAAFGESRDALTWIMDARAPSQFRGSVGRPRNTPDACVTPISITPDGSDAEPLTVVTDTPDVGDVIPLTVASGNTTKNNTTNETPRGRSARSHREAPQKEILERSELIGAQALQSALDAENFWRPANPPAWLKAVAAEPSLSNITRHEATDIARAAKSASSVAQGKRPETPGVGEIVGLVAKLSAAQAPDGSAPSAVVWWQDPAKVAEITDSQWRGSIAKHANGVWPPDKLGPAPGSKRCVVPQRLIDELRLTERYDANGISRTPLHQS